MKTSWKSSSAISSLFRRFSIVSQSNQTVPSFQFLCKRSYNVDGEQMGHFTRRLRRSFSPSIILSLGIATGVVTVYHANQKTTVPGTIPSYVERQIGEAAFKSLKQRLKKNILPPEDPDSVRMQIILKKIIEGLQRETQPIDLSDEGKKKTGYVKRRGKDEVIDANLEIQRRTRMALKPGGYYAPTTPHLESLNWEIVVVRNPEIHALSLPAGKIIVFTGLLDHFRTDAEIATFIAREVGLAVARNVLEGTTRNLWISLVYLILVQFVLAPGYISLTYYDDLISPPLSLSTEFIADCIGEILMASAGYDPRVMSEVYRKWERVWATFPGHVLGAREGPICVLSNRRH